MIYTGFLAVVGDCLFPVTGARNVTLLNPVLYPFQMIYKITISRVHTHTCKNNHIPAAAAAAVYGCMFVTLHMQHKSVYSCLCVCV